MAHTGRVWKDPYLMINSVEQSEHVASIDPGRNWNKVRDALPGQYTKYVMGQDDMVPKVKFSRGIVSAGVSAALQALHEARAAVAVAIRQNKTAAISTDNPEYTASCFINVLTPFGGQIDQLEEMEVELVPATEWVYDATP